MFPNTKEFNFIPPPEAPVFEPDEEEWKDPLAYIAKIYPYAVKCGICKIRPPPEWQPTFSVDVEKFRFTPRIQKLNELEAKTRCKLNFIDKIAKFWELQGAPVKLPNIEKKPLDVYQLHKIVQAEGGYEDVTRLRRWSRVSLLMGYNSQQTSASLRKSYEKILYPYDVFASGAMTGENEENIKAPPILEPVEEVEELEHQSIEGKSPVKYGTRRSKYRSEITDNTPEIDYTQSNELKRLQFLAPGPKISGGQSKKDESLVHPTIHGMTRRKPPCSKRDNNIFDVVASFVDDYKCNICENGDDEASMLLCDSCDSSYHTFCLIPPLPSIPPGDWRCPKCLAKECQKPMETFGFEQAKRTYSLQEFGLMADRFKEEYFSMPPHEVPSNVVEKEFWRLVESMDDDVMVEYGADLHTKEVGSGFPMRSNTDDPDDEEYINSVWNLNNLPNNDKSVLKYITQNISGMKVPWIYIGMCFSSFCWHTEDHWSYSINYLHWGEPKTWYGVPQTEAEKLEKCMRSVAPELFEKNPDLLHHLVTTCSPNTLMDFGVPVVRTNQYAGEFVVTFPRAYHSGFNQGYNCAEAVNFCPADWLPTGLECVEHYSLLKRTLVFSHQELISRMAAAPDTLDLDLAKKLYENMKIIVDNEILKRKELHEKGIKDRQHEAFELLGDDERQCDYCKFTMFFSAVVCSCNKKRLACLRHVDEICVCQNYKKYIRYRYTLDELPEMLKNLKKRADSFDNWEKEAQKALSYSAEDRLDLQAFKDLITESEESQFPDCELLEQLKSSVTEAEQCALVANQLLTKKHKTRKTTSSSTTTSSPQLSLDELKDFVTQVQNLPCSIKETKAINNLMGQVESFRYDAKKLLNSEEYNESKVMELLEHAETMDIDLPEVYDLKLDLKAAKWLEQIEDILNQEDPISLDVIRNCVDQGIGLRKKQASEKPLSRLKELLYAADRWEEKAKLCLQAKPRHMMGTLEVIVQEASKVKIILPNVTALQDALQKAKEWSSRVEKIQNDDYYPYYDILEALVVKGRPIPVRLEQLPQMESQVAAARAWKDRTARTFVKKGSNKQLIELLRPRKDVGKFDQKSKKQKALERSESSDKEKDEKPDIKEKTTKGKKEKKSKTKESKVDVKSVKVEEESKPIGIPVDAFNADEYVAPDPLTVAETLKKDEEDEINTMKELRKKNVEKLKSDNIDAQYCLCRKPVDGFMVRCSLCYEWYHSPCIVVPKTVHGKPIGKGYTPWTAAREVRYLCPLCNRSRRPRLDTILSLLMSLQKLPVRVPEGEALQFLTERAMNWQDRAKNLLNDVEIQRVMNEVKTEFHRANLEKQNAATISQAVLIQKLLQVQKRDSQNNPIVSNMKTETIEDVTTDTLTSSTPLTTSTNTTTTTTTTQMDVDPPPEDPTKTDLLNVCSAITISTAVDAVIPEHSSLSPTKPDKGGAKDLESALECTEEMSGSPVEQKDIIIPPLPSITDDSSISNPQVVQLQSASSSRAQSPIDVCTPIENLKAKLTNKLVTMDPLSTPLLDDIEDLMFEGDLLEVGLDEVAQLWAVIQIQRPLLKEDCNILNADYRRKIIKERKKQRKRKLEESKAPLPIQSLQPIMSTLPLSSSTSSLASNTNTKTTNTSTISSPLNILSEKSQPEAKKIKEEVKVKKEAATIMASSASQVLVVDEDENDEDDCAARPCQKPLGEEVEWVQCDKCENWYHVVCVGISAEEASTLDEYLCPRCKKPEKIFKKKIKEEPMELDLKAEVTPSVFKNDTPKISDLNVMAQVAHQLIADAENNKKSEQSSEIVVSSSPCTPCTPAENEQLAVDSLICLAGVSEQMDALNDLARPVVVETTVSENSEISKPESSNVVETPHPEDTLLAPVDATSTVTEPQV